MRKNSNTQKVLSECYSIKAAAEQLEINRQTLWLATRREEIPVYCLGDSSSVVRLPDVQEWLEDAPNRRPGPKPQ